MAEFLVGGTRFAGLLPLVDGVVPPYAIEREGADGIAWRLDDGGRVELAIAREGDVVRLGLSCEGLPAPMALGLRFVRVEGVARYLRNGWHSWDGSYFVTPGSPPPPHAKSPDTGHAMTALVTGGGVTVLGFDRHDRFQTRLRFRCDAAALSIDAETLLDATGTTAAESLFLFAEGEVEQGLRRWSGRVAAASPLPPTLPARRITGWCSWYNLYAAITEENLLEHLDAARAFRDTHKVPFDVFLVDDGFTPEMGDWLEVKPQFPRGMQPLLAEAAAAGFVPGLWIAPFVVGNRSRLFREHPDWVVQDADGGPLVQMRFYGEFRWHKRSEEYYVLDITHPGAEAYMREVFRRWTGEWGARLLKIDFLFHGADHGPDRAVHHVPGLSRIAVWRRMMELVREESHGALVIGCGSPLWASVGLVDAIRIGRDVGVRWTGEDQSAQSLLQVQQTRNHASGILWQSDPDCVLLRDRFHELTDAQVETLAWLAGLSGGVLLTSDSLHELPPERQELLARLLRLQAGSCSFPLLGQGTEAVEQVATLADGRTARHRFDPATGEGQVELA